MTSSVTQGSEDHVRQFLDISEVARLLDVSDATIRRFIRARQLHYVRLGSRIRIARSELDRFLSEMTDRAPRVPIGRRSRTELEALRHGLSGEALAQS